MRRRIATLRRTVSLSHLDRVDNSTDGFYSSFSVIVASRAKVTRRGLAITATAGRVVNKSPRRYLRARNYAAGQQGVSAHLPRLISGENESAGRYIICRGSALTCDSIIGRARVCVSAKRKCRRARV